MLRLGEDRYAALRARRNERWHGDYDRVLASIKAAA